jgi:hypothetical protein
MAREPQFPKDAAVGETPAASGSSAPAPAGRSAGEDKAGDKAGDGKRTKQIVTGAAIGIGSAAIVAALLYANRRGKNDKN